ncbi:MAG: hypothetical protein ACYTED_18985 [Planctomycetota bacterium]|jgi:hypothetical protein
MWLWDVLSGRLGHWSKTETALLMEIMRRLDDYPPELAGFRNWLASYSAATCGALCNPFLHNRERFPESYTRLKSMSKESFRSLHALFVAHHIGIQLAIGEQEGTNPFALELVPKYVRLTAAVLAVSERSLRGIMHDYEGKGDIQIGIQLWRRIAGIVGIEDSNVEEMICWRALVASIADSAATLTNAASP